MPAHRVGEPVAFFTPEYQWVLGKVTSFDSRSQTFSCSSTDPEFVTVDNVSSDAAHLWFPRAESINEDVDDLLNLTELHEASLLFCLRKRYFRDVVYTNIGPIIIALNPFSYSIPWYMENRMINYLSEGNVVEKNLPHPWATAHNTYWEMRESGQNQTVLISGESGAGKTEIVKVLLRYLGELSTKNGTLEDRDSFSKVNKRVLAASPILESFGNAKTVRNDNSSRFGKFSRVQFDMNGILIGCHVTKYLLEKSRVVTAAKSERVFHSFYQLALGPRAQEFSLRNHGIYRVLNSGNCITIDGVDDTAEYAVTKQAMDDVGISEEEQSSVWRIVAGVLFLQNVDFVESEDCSGRAAKLDTNLLPVMGRVCELWGLDDMEFKSEILSTCIITQKEQTIKLLNKVQALDMRDSACKSIYDWLFNWLVQKINDTTDCESKTSNWIGLLDIFGFENFQRNSFEQLCINLANEVLQGHYNQHVFAMDMRECAEECVDTTHVAFSDNKECIELLMGKVSVLTLLDEECAVSGTERNYLQKLVEKFGVPKEKGGSSYFLQTRGRAVDNSFTIRHYAADIQYCVDGFLNKNRDTLKESMKQVFLRSTVDLIPKLVPKEEGRSTIKMTISGHFVKQLSELMLIINRTNPHWIRCIKPDASRQPRRFSTFLVMNQLRSAGVLETVKIRKAGYPIRFTYTDFLYRYRSLWSGNADGKNTCESILKQCNVTAKQAQLGKSKVFLNHEGYGLLNHEKDKILTRMFIAVQAAGRGMLCRGKLFHSYLSIHRQRILEERRMREEELRQQKDLEERRLKSEAAERERRERLLKERRYSAAVRIQKIVRGMLTRKIFLIMYLSTLRAREEHVRDDELLKYRAYERNNNKRIRAMDSRATEHVDSRMDIFSSSRRELMRERRERTIRLIREKNSLSDMRDKKEMEDEKARRVQGVVQARHSAQEAGLNCVSAKSQRMKTAQEESERRCLNEMVSILRHSSNESCGTSYFDKETDCHMRSHPKEKREIFPTQDLYADSEFETARSQWVEAEWWKDERVKRLLGDTKRQSGPLTKHQSRLEDEYRVELLTRVLQEAEAEKVAATFKRQRVNR